LPLDFFFVCVVQGRVFIYIYIYIYLGSGRRAADYIKKKKIPRLGLTTEQQATKP